MKKIKKILIIAGLAVVGLIVVGLIVSALLLDRIVMAGVETVGPQLTQVSIKLDSVHIGLLTGSASVKGLLVGNPEGYKTPFAIKVGVAKVNVSPFSVLSDKIVVRSVHVESPEITFEGGLTGNNLSKILDNVNAFTKSAGPASTNAASPGTQPGKKIEVDDFLITGAKVHVSLTGTGGQETTLPLPDIHLTGLGQNRDSLTPADLTRVVLSSITTATLKVVAGSATDIGKGVGNLGKDAGKAVGTEADKIKKGLGGLFGK